MNKRVNIYGRTECYEFGVTEYAYDGFGYENKNGEIIWYDDYEPQNDEFHITTIIRYGNPDGKAE